MLAKCVAYNYTGKDVELSAVEVELNRVSEGKDITKEVKQQQLALFTALTKDISEPTVTLVSKLNCDTKRWSLKRIFNMHYLFPEQCLQLMSIC